MADGDQKQVGYGATETAAIVGAATDDLAATRPPNNTSWLIEARVIAQSVTTPADIYAAKLACCGNTASSTSTIQDSPGSAIYEYAGGGKTLDAYFTTSGQDVLVHCVGDAAAGTTRWFVVTQMMHIECTDT